MEGAELAVLALLAGFFHPALSLGPVLLASFLGMEQARLFSLSLFFAGFFRKYIFLWR